MSAAKRLEAPKLSKVEKLRVAGEAAPALRRREPRKVTLVDADGNPTRVTTDVEVAQGALEHLGIEIAVQPGGMPTEIVCERCRLVVRKVKPGRIPRFCIGCTADVRREKARARQARLQAESPDKLREARRRSAAKHRSANRAKNRSQVTNELIEYLRAESKARQAAKAKKGAGK